MNKEFVPYGPALELKEIEFNEPCFMFYEQETSSKYLQKGINDEYWGDYSEPRDWNSIPNKPWKPFCQCVSAPTFSQAFRWFRETYKIISVIDFYNDGEEWEDTEYKVTISEFEHFATHDTFAKEGYVTYEEAELECLKGLIKIAKSK